MLLRKLQPKRQLRKRLPRNQQQARPKQSLNKAKISYPALIFSFDWNQEPLGLQLTHEI
jgi:hypothetical protein